MHLASKPTAVRFDGKIADWTFDRLKGVLQLKWNAATAQASEIKVVR
jgi:hypothetical protein